MDTIKILIAQTEDYLKFAIEDRDAFVEANTLPDGSLEFPEDRERLALLEDRIRSIQQCLDKAREILSPADEPMPAVWIQPEMMRRRLIAGPGERAEVSAHYEPEAGFTVPLYAAIPNTIAGEPGSKGGNQ